MGTLPVLRESTPVSSPLWRTVDWCERGAALALFAASLPVLAGSALAVWAMSGRSPWIAHARVGWRGKTLWMIKLRTMWSGRERTPGWIEYISDDAGPAQKSEDDPRVANWFAGFCRRHSIDELPQLWHVIRGEMSLVGPRPMTRREVRRHYGEDAEELLQVKPGMAGLWQVSGRNRLSYTQRRELDLRFVRNRSLRLYGQILLRTLPEVWRGSNSW